MLKKKLKSTLYDLSKNNKVILLYPSPISPVNVLDRIKNKWVNHNFENDKIYLKDKINYSVKFYRKFNEDIIKLFDSINSSSIFKIKLEPVFCPNNQCIFFDNEHSYFFDNIHPSYEGSRKINDLIMREINKIDKQIE